MWLIYILLVVVHAMKGRHGGVIVHHHHVCHGSSYYLHDSGYMDKHTHDCENGHHPRVHFKSHRIINHNFATSAFYCIVLVCFVGVGVGIYYFSRK